MPKKSKKSKLIKRERIAIGKEVARTGEDPAVVKQRLRQQNELRLQMIEPRRQQLRQRKKLDAVATLQRFGRGFRARNEARQLRLLNQIDIDVGGGLQPEPGVAQPAPAPAPPAPAPAPAPPAPAPAPPAPDTDTDDEDPDDVDIYLTIGEKEKYSKFTEGRLKPDDITGALRRFMGDKGITQAQALRPGLFETHLAITYAPVLDPLEEYKLKKENIGKKIEDRPFAEKGRALRFNQQLRSLRGQAKIDFKKEQKDREAQFEAQLASTPPPPEPQVSVEDMEARLAQLTGSTAPGLATPAQPAPPEPTFVGGGGGGIFSANITNLTDPAFRASLAEQQLQEEEDRIPGAIDDLNQGIITAEPEKEEDLE